MRRTEIPLSKVGSHHVTLLDAFSAFWHPSGLKFHLVWGGYEGDGDNVGTRSPALLYFWSPGLVGISSTGRGSFAREPWPAGPSLGLYEILIDSTQPLAEGGWCSFPGCWGNSLGAFPMSIPPPMLWDWQEVKSRGYTGGGSREQSKSLHSCP